MRKHYYIANSRVLTHLLFWVCYMLVNTGVHAEAERGTLFYFLEELGGLPAAVLVAYVNMYVLFPRFFLRKKYLAYTVSAVLLLFVGSVINRIVQEKFFEPVFYPDTTYREQVFVWYMIFKGMLWFLSPVLLFTLVVKIFSQWFSQEQRHQEIVREKLEAELNFLKAQVHPHFLFNTLNNLYSLTLQASPAAPKVVLKLSGLMSYMLYDSRADNILLDKEITHIRNYIELEKIRYSQPLDVSFNVSGDVNCRQIAPLLLIPFVENAFKHGVSNETDPVWVTIDVKVKDDVLSVKVENSHTENDAFPAADAENNGIGLRNVIRRLELLYPGRHTLALKKESGRFTVDLKINLEG
ncbi:sensor histidine kinase [Chitinophaga barathri]|uniref:Sensor histidine kinase n=1 Tax=Chitinophaga barathri TaxID=1647451 RepID=A0A3N4MLP5_9BACT|nr:histidine kinase [Chitinophaga barathri]RPD42907.1 sensor histidine kinase [Chitinophaga barathri]